MDNECDFPRQPGRTRTILVTGAAGVVGQALLPRLIAGPDGGRSTGRRIGIGHNADVIALTHHREITVPGATAVRGSITAPQLGLSVPDYEALADRVDVVVHSAAMTGFNQADGQHTTINVDGTREVLRFAAHANAPVVHVSTAFLHPTDDPEHPRKSVRYAESKRAGEELVRASGVPHTIVRPSIVIGHSTTGETSAFQGVYQVSAALMKGMLPLLPFERVWPFDLIPCDVVADAIATVVEHNLFGREFWLTAGDNALTVDQAVQLLVRFARSTGRLIDQPRFVAPDMYHRLIAPVFLDALPRGMRMAVSSLMDLFIDYVSMPEPFPSSLTELAEHGAAATFDAGDNLLASLDFWHEATGQSARREAVA
ncbi:MAG: SDR family oxidoreductase [Nakamurella sp.]